MTDGRDPFERRLGRDDFLKLAAVAGGTTLLAGPAAAARAAGSQLAAGVGRLQVLDWAGYGNDGGQAMFAAYVKRYPNNKPQFTYMTNEADALAKIHAGLKPDIFRPYVGWVKYFATSGLVQPWDTKLIPNFKHLNPFMVKAGQYNGKQYGIPDDWGFDAILYRTDKVKPKAQSWGLLFDERYKGKIAWFDDLEMLVMTGLYLGFKDPWNQTDAQLKQSQKLLISKKQLVRMIWSSETDLWQAFGVGRHLDRLRVAERLGADEEEGAEGRLHAPEGEADRLGRDAHAAARGRRAPNLAHAYVDAWSSAKSAKWLEDNYGYGHANTQARPSSSDLLRALQLTNPKAVTQPNAHLDRDIPRRAVYAEDVGRGEGLLTGAAGRRTGDAASRRGVRGST